MKTNKNGGFIKMLIIILAVILLLSYFKFDLREFIDSPPVQKNLSYVWDLLQTAWNDYLSKPILYFWNNIFVELIWDNIRDVLEGLKKPVEGSGEEALRAFNQLFS